MTTATTAVRRRARDRAAWLGTYPSSAMAALTEATTWGATRSRLLTTRDAVARDTPAKAATVSSVGGRPGSAGVDSDGTTFAGRGRTRCCCDGFFATTLPPDTGRQSALTSTR